MGSIKERKYSAFLILGISSDAIIQVGDKYYPCYLPPIKRFPDIFSRKEVSCSLVLFRGEGVYNDTFKARILIETPPERKSTLLEGMELMHGFQDLLAIYHFCITRVVDYNYSLLPITDSLLEIAPPWNRQMIEANCREEIEYCYNYVDEFRREFSFTWHESVDEVELLIQFFGGYFEFPDVRKACSYLFSSMKELGLDVCDWREENYAEDSDKFISIGSAESSFLSAYKCIEALIGEPSKDRTEHKLKECLQQLGIDPMERVGYSQLEDVKPNISQIPPEFKNWSPSQKGCFEEYSDILIRLSDWYEKQRKDQSSKKKESILLKTRKYYSMRDSTAAHGSGSRKQPLKLGQIIDLQALARDILLQTIAHRLGIPIYEEQVDKVNADEK